MRSLLYIVCFLACLPFVSCNRTALYEQRAKTLDSLSGAVNNLASVLQKQDTVQLQEDLTQYSYYSSFIEASRFDTLNKEEADHLQRFYHSGMTLVSFSENRKTILARILLLNSQYKRLAADIRSRAGTIDQLDAFVEQEKREAAQVLELGNQQQQEYFRSLEEYHRSVKEVEKIIRLYNNGQLPIIVTDTSS
jgi:hypothetical protein